MATTKTEDRYLIEREGRPLGMVVAEPHGYVVYACAKQIWPLDRKAFQSFQDAEKRITQCARKSR